MLFLASAVLLVLVARGSSVGLPAGGEGAEVERLQALEEVLEEAAGKPPANRELEGDRKQRVVREDSKPIATDAGGMTKEQVAGPRMPRNLLDIPWAREAAKEPDSSRSHFGSGFGSSGQQQQQPAHVTFNLQAPPSPGYVQQGFAPPRPASGVGCGGQTVTIQDTHFATQHVPQTYTASVPYIAGYRLTPVLGQKQITLNDLANGGSAGWGAGGCLPTGQPGYWQNLYTHAKQADKEVTAEDPMEPNVQSAGPDQLVPTIKAAGPDQLTPTIKAAGPDQTMSQVKLVTPEEMWPNMHISPPDQMWPQMKASPPDQMWPLMMKASGPDQMWPLQMRAPGPSQMWPVQMRGAGPEQNWPVHIKPEDILRPFEQARFFQPPLEVEKAHGLAAPHEYQARIDDMGHQIEHLESLRDSTPDDDNKVE